MFAEHQRGLGRCHQAGVKTDEVEGNARFRQSVVELGERHRASLRIFFIVAVTGNGTPAVIPQDEFVTVGFEVLFTEFDETDQSVRIDHRTGTGIVDQAADLAVADDLVDLIDPVGDDIGVPPGGTAGIDDEVDVVGDPGGCHLL